MRADDRVTYPVIGAAMQVHRELGPGFLELTYQRALAVELGARGIAFQREVAIPVWYRGVNLGTFRADFQCADSVLLELKAIPFVGESPINQLAHYLAATGKSVGLLLNFGTASLQVRRVLPRRSTLCGPPANVEFAESMGKFAESAYPSK